MRLLEITISILLAVYLFWRRSHPFWIRLLPALALIVIPFHIIIEGYRWQMIPLYALTVLLAIRASTMRGSMDWKPLASFLTLLLVSFSTALPVLLPVPSLPKPSGPYEVGTRIFELTDPARQEIYSGKDEPRRFQIQVWYPAEVNPTDQHAPWMVHANVFAPAIASYIHMPSFFLDHLALVKMPAYKESKVAAAKGGFPVILFSHGWNGFNAQNTGQAIELASHGYVVVGVQHT
jgi:predicted dienelactone hydrolase